MRKYAQHLNQVTIILYHGLNEELKQGVSVFFPKMM